MAKPIRFMTRKELKIVNRCLICGERIPSNRVLCSRHDKMFKRGVNG